MVRTINPKELESALGFITDGFVFEDLAQSFLSAVLGASFAPVGGLKDRGIDGLDHSFSRDGVERTIFQASIDAAPERKLNATLDKLQANKIPFDQVTYVTNQVFPDQDRFVDDVYSKHKKVVRIYDLRWFTANANYSQGTVNAYQSFVDTYLHKYQQPGTAYRVEDLQNDPRLFVFLRQQLDAERKDLAIDDILAESLILFALEDTDPDKGKFLTNAQIKDRIAQLIRFDPKLIHSKIDHVLANMSSKPDRRIKYDGRASAYCLAYEGRLEIQGRNLQEAALEAEFKRAVTDRLRKHLQGVGTRVSDLTALIDRTIHKLFYMQGLEFANFVHHNETDVFEKSLPDVISAVVNESAVVAKNRESVKSALLMTVRDVVYNGTHDEKLFLQRLSNTYMVLFLLQVDPKLTTFFDSLASELEVFVGTSVLIPALSELYLESFNRRYWSLLKGAHSAGVTLRINDTILDELVDHFKKITQRYRDEFKDQEQLYLGDEVQSLYIEDIMLRAYFYAKARGKVATFHDFIDQFVSPTLENARESLAEFLKVEFGIAHVSTRALDVTIDEHEAALLYDQLKSQKRGELQAERDSRFILTIFALREKNNETAGSGIFGYKTWWLSTDTITQRVVSRVFGTKYQVSCYIRPDFLYNYISLAPRRQEVDDAYLALFPSLIGVNIGFHLPDEVMRFVRERILQFRKYNKARLSAVLQELTNKVKSDTSFRTREKVEPWLDSRLREIEAAEH